MKKVILCLFIALSVLIEIFIFNFRSFELLGCREQSRSFMVEPDAMHYENGQLIFEIRGKENIPADLRSAEIMLSEEPSLPVHGGIQTEEIHLQKGHYKKFYWTPGIPHSQNIALFPANRVHVVRFYLTELPLQTIEVRFNQPLPMRIDGLRLLMIFCGITLLYLLRPASELWQVQLNLNDSRQKSILILLLILFSVFWVWTDFSSYPDLSNMHVLKGVEANSKFQYERLTDALMRGSLSLLIEPPAELAAMDNPYDPDARREMKNVLWDTVYYQGKYYIYFGIVPVLTLFLPYRLIIGTHLSADAAIILYSILGSIGFVCFYTRMIRRHFPKIPAVLYFLGIPLLLNGSCLMCCLRKPMVYEIAMSAAFCFSVWGLYFNSNTDLNKWNLVIGCTLMALAVGCKPTSIGLSLLNIPLIVFPLWEKYRGKITKTLPTLFCCAVPYALIGLGLAWYNYARFGNPLEFGQNYNLTNADNRALSSGNAWGNLLFSYVNFFIGSGFQLLSRFPFIKEADYLRLDYGGTRFLQNLVPVSNLCVWVLAIPFVGFVRTFFRAKGKTFAVLFRWLILCSLIIGAVCGSVGFFQRYCLDFYWPMIFAGFCVFLLFYEWATCRGSEKALRAVFLLSMGFSLLVALGMWVGEPSVNDRSWLESFNPLLFEKLNYFFAFWL